MAKKKRNPIENFGDKINTNGLDKRKEDINRTGLNKGSGWNKNLLERFMSVDLTDTEIEQFAKIKKQFPSLFRDDDALNYQTFLEVKQISLAFHKDPKVAQSAIEKIKDRIEGKSISREAQVDTDGNDINKEPETKEELKVRIEKLKLRKKELANERRGKKNKS